MVDVLRIWNIADIEMDGKQGLIGASKLATSVEWVDGCLYFSAKPNTSEKDIILFCIEETRKQALAKRPIERAKLEIHLEKLIANETSIQETLYRQYLVYKNGKYALVDASLRISRLKDGRVIVDSSIVPETAKIDIPEDEWWYGARDITVGRHPYATDPYDFWITFQKGVYKLVDEEEERVAFVDSKGDLLGDGRTNDFLGLKRLNVF